MAIIIMMAMIFKMTVMIIIDDDGDGDGDNYEKNDDHECAKNVISSSGKGKQLKVTNVTCQS